MTVERSCKTCGLSSLHNGTGEGCGSLGISYCVNSSKWQPIAQEKPMEKIQYTQQEWVSIIDDLGWNPDVMEELKQKGYIRKSAVEEAEEMYQEWLYAMEATSSPINKDNLNVKLYEAIQELKSEIARLKK